MARQNHGPLSRAKGKLGGVVYQQYEGMQISREYQPVVKNPQTDKQTKNRAKFKLASQITAQFSYVINPRLSKLSIYNRVKRGASVQAIVSAIPASQGSTPNVNVANIINALNEKSMPDFSDMEITPTAGTGISIVATSGDIVLVTMVGYDEDGSFVNKTNETYTSSGTAKQIPVVSESSNCYMAVALRATTEAGRATISNVLADDPTFAIEISRAVANGDILVSNIVGGFVAGE